MSEVQESANKTISSPVTERLGRIRFRMKRERFRLSEEIRLIPKKLFVLMIVLFLAAQTVAHVVLSQAGDPWPDLGRMMALTGVVTAISILAAFLVFLIVYVNRDAKRRGMNSALWTFLVVILLPAYLATGFIIYFLVREPLPYKCPQCDAIASARFNYCPQCKFNLRPACPQCNREVQIGDRFCSHCAHELSASPAQDK